MPRMSGEDMIVTLGNDLALKGGFSWAHRCTCHSAEAPLGERLLVRGARDILIPLSQSSSCHVASLILVCTSEVMGHDGGAWKCVGLKDDHIVIVLLSLIVVIAA